MTLPGEVSAVTAGCFVLTRNARDDALGQFVYRAKYLERADAVEIVPVELKLSKRTYETVLLNGVFGALRDGRRNIARLDSTLTMKLDEINTAFDLMHEGKSIRSVVVY